MKKAIVYGAALVVLVGAGVAYSAASPGAKLQKQDRVYGGGQLAAGCFALEDGTPSLPCFEAARNLSVDAHAEGNGAEAVGDSNYAAPPSGDVGKRTVTCLSVEGTHAVIGGVITSGADAGYGYVQFFVDRGTVGTGQRDLVSPSYTDPVAVLTELFPGFPTTCPPPRGTSDVRPAYRTLDWGDLVVQDAPSS